MRLLRTFLYTLNTKKSFSFCGQFLFHFMYKVSDIKDVKIKILQHYNSFNHNILQCIQRYSFREYE